ncbi:MAG: asparagine--tRNA ligase [Spirochaetaceae bacterium]|jgi:asparaginyl-tRNA synthetase|nr:asparagine--tRNA ligase [Spirochaetaceae bacterium]
MDLLKEALANPVFGAAWTARGWVRTKRDMKSVVFVEVNDGSCMANLQCTFNREAGLPTEIEAELAKAVTGAAVVVEGTLAESPAAGQVCELAAKTIRVIGEAGAGYPLQKKRHSLEFLREMSHLRARTNTFGAVARVRSSLAFAVHAFFKERGFQYVHTPVITASDAEGAGAMFRVSADIAGPDGEKRPFFGRNAYLTVSGQLEAETYAMALSRVYTFGPTFRAENSNTARHLAEFWMIEPEAAFFELRDNMALAEDFIKFLLGTALEECGDDLAFFDKRIRPGLIDTLSAVVSSKFTHIPYTDAVAELGKNAGRFVFKPSWGFDLQSEHETFLTEEVARGPVIVTDYPASIKAFYMKMNDDGKTVRAMDVLVPRLGEIIGGSEREADLEKLEKRMKSLGMDTNAYSWYLDLRRYGSAPHSGFGLGFERLIQYVTGMVNIRDVIPYPRAVGQAAP